MIQALSRRLGAYYIVVLALALACYAVGGYQVARRVMMADVDDGNRRLLRPAATLYDASAETLPELFHEFTEFSLEPGERAAVLDLRGQVLFLRGAALPGGRLPTVPGPSTEGNLRAWTMPLTRGGRLHGYLYVASSWAHEQAALQSIAVALGAFAPLLLGFASLAGGWLGRKATLPVELAMERERQFTRDASHELRTPLSVIQLECQLALRTQGLPAEAAERLAHVEAAARRMSRLVADLLALAREDSGLQGRRLSFSLADLVDEEVEAIAPLAGTRAVTVAYAPETAEAEVSGDPTLLGLAVRNLLDNAVRYSPKGSRVAVGLARTQDRYLLTVRSPGPPLAGADREQIFERFVRLPAGRAANQDGSGLGLAIARAVAVAHGGAMELLPADGEGNTFALAVPAGRVPESFPIPT